MAHEFNGPYTGEHLARVAFPLGGLGAGMVCLEGTGALSHVSVRHEPRVFWEPPGVFAAVSVVGRPELARVAEGPVPDWKKFGPPGSGNGSAGATYGLPRFERARFTPRFPFAYVELSETDHPLAVRIEGWSPFTPPDPDPSSLPIAAIEYELENVGTEALDVVFSFNARNFMAVAEGEVRRTPGGFILSEAPRADDIEHEGYFCAAVDRDDAAVNASWFRGAWFDALTIAWQDIVEGRAVDARPPAFGPPSPGGSLFVPLSLEPGESETVRLLLSWYVPRSTLTTGRGESDCKCSTSEEDCDCGDSCERPTYRPWYATQFAGIEGVHRYWVREYDGLKRRSAVFTESLYDVDSPPAILEAVAANLTILKSPTILRQADGRMWMWEGCHDSAGCCPGSCTHVWNYAQATAHLFPSLERGVRETEHGEALSSEGHQVFRVPLPIRPSTHESIPASDGQLGSVMRVYREWRISGDTDWLRSLWPAVQASLDFCIRTWDPDKRGVLEEPHHNTYDIEFWGADPMCTGFYLGALRAAELMGRALGEQTDEYEELYSKGRAQMETDLFNGEYFYQKTQWTGLKTDLPVAGSGVLRGRECSAEEQSLAEAEGPKYQYGSGCLSDQLLGDWLARMSGIGPIIDREKVESAMIAVARHNFRANLRTHANAQRPTFALGNDGGLLNCSWPRGDKPTLPFVYSEEVWTGIEYQVASHLQLLGRGDQTLKLVQAVRRRYDGRVRNPFNEYECGHWYGRALSSYGLLNTGIRYDAVRKAVVLQRQDDFRTLLATAGGFGIAGIADGAPFVDVRWGEIDVEEFVFE